MCSRTSHVVLKSTKGFDLGGRGAQGEKGIAKGEARESGDEGFIRA